MKAALPTPQGRNLSNSAVYQAPTTYLTHLVNFSNWITALTLRRFTISLWNSLAVAMLATVASLAIGAICAYALARLRFLGKNLVLAMILAVAMFPGVSIVSPLYLKFRDWGLINNKLSLPLVALVLVFQRRIVARLTAGAVKGGAPEPTVLFGAVRGPLFLTFSPARGEGTQARRLAADGNRLTSPADPLP